MITKKDVMERLGYVNKILKTDYRSDFASHYGGWNMYLVDNRNGGHYRGKYGFDYRKTTREFYQYLLGIIVSNT